MKWGSPLYSMVSLLPFSIILEAPQRSLKIMFPGAQPDNFGPLLSLRIKGIDIYWRRILTKEPSDLLKIMAEKLSILSKKFQRKWLNCWALNLTRSSYVLPVFVKPR